MLDGMLPMAPGPAGLVGLGVRWLLSEQLAVDSEDQMLLPIPKSVRARGKALEQILQSLLNQGFVEEVPVGLADEAWRSDHVGRFGLRITVAGLQAIGVPALVSGLEQPSASRPGSKRAKLITMLMQPGGVNGMGGLCQRDRHGGWHYCCQQDVPGELGVGRMEL
jgi:hypothetical protein